MRPHRRVRSQFGIPGSTGHRQPAEDIHKHKLNLPPEALHVYRLPLLIWLQTLEVTACSGTNARVLKIVGSALAGLTGCWFQLRWLYIRFRVFLLLSGPCTSLFISSGLGSCYQPHRPRGMHVTSLPTACSSTHGCKSVWQLRRMFRPAHRV